MPVYAVECVQGAHPGWGPFEYAGHERTRTARPPAGGKKQSGGLFFSARALYFLRTTFVKQ